MQKVKFSFNFFYTKINNELILLLNMLDDFFSVFFFLLSAGNAGDGPNNDGTSPFDWRTADNATADGTAPQ